MAEITMTEIEQSLATIGKVYQAVSLLNERTGCGFPAAARAVKKHVRRHARKYMKGQRAISEQNKALSNWAARYLNGEKE